MNIEKYLARIDYKGPTSPTLEVLKTLLNKHLLSVPFENLDIHYKVPIELNLEKIFDKVVNRGRGGFCYELNGLFYDLLRTIGFEVKMISARVFSQKGQDFSPEFDHLAIIARVNSRDYLVDVGFGEFALEPLVIQLNEKQIDKRGVFMIGKHDDTYYEVKNLLDEKWLSVYMFSLKKRDLGEFQERCLYQQTSPESHFTQNKLCSLATDKGRITLTAQHLKIREQDKTTEVKISSETEFLSCLEKFFGIRLNNSVEHAVSLP